jgi:hypothetical protein
MVRHQIAAEKKMRAPRSPARESRHDIALRASSFLTLTHRQMYQPKAAMIAPETVIKLLNRAQVKFVLMGTHGIGGWRSEPRATQDVDILVRKRDHRKAVEAVRHAFPELTVSDYPVVTRFTDPVTGYPVIDLMKPTQPIFQAVFRNTIAVGLTHVVPRLEMAIVSKFAAMTSPNRAMDKKLIDGGDLVNMVKTNRDELDRPRLRRLAERVYPGGGDELGRMVDDIFADRPIQF